MTDPRARTDDDLVRSATDHPAGRDGRAAVAELFGRYHGRVYTWCLKHVRDHDRALDLAQDVMLSAYRNLDSFGGRSAFSSWLFAIARNRCITALRPASLLRDESAEPDALPAAAADPLDAIADAQEEDAMLALIRETLETDEQTAIWLRCFERMPVDEITDIMNLRGASGARGLLQTARRKLRAALAHRAEGQGST